MKTGALIASIAVLGLLAGGCSAPLPALTGCPAPPEVTVSDQTDGMDEMMMEAVAAETNRFGNGLIGMAEGAAQQCVEDAGLTWRVYEQDGELFALTMDYRAERVNVKIEKDIISDAYSG